MGRKIDHKRVKQIFKNNPYEKFKIDGLLAGCNYDTDYKEGMKKYAQRLCKDGIIERVGRGEYQYKGEQEEVKKILHAEFPNIHFLQIYGHSEGTDIYLKGEGSPAFGTRDTRDKERDKLRTSLGLGQSIIDYWQYEGNKMVYKCSWEGRGTQIKLSPPNRVEVDLSASNDDLDYYMLWGWFNWIKGWFSPIDWNDITWDYCNFGLNIDTGEIRVYDAKRVTYREFENEMRAYYDKTVKNKTRKEIHAQRVNLPITELIKSLRGDMPLGIADLSDQIKQLKEIARIQGKKDRELRALLDKLLIKLSDTGLKAVVRYG